MSEKETEENVARDGNNPDLSVTPQITLLMSIVDGAMEGATL
jgi:hypothetical protein